MTKRRVAVLVISLIALCLILVFAFYDSTATHAINAHLPTGMRLEKDIRGAFPLHFKVPKMTVVPNTVTIDNLVVDYEGTYNPFKLMSQRGNIMRASGTVHVVLGEKRVLDITIANANVEHIRRGWRLTSTLVIDDVVVFVNIFFFPNEVSDSYMKVEVGDATMLLYTDELLVTYTDHELVHVSLTDSNLAKQRFSVDVATIAHVSGEVNATRHDSIVDIVWTDVFLHFFDHIPVNIPRLKRVHLHWDGVAHSLAFTADDVLSLKIQGDDVVVGHVRTVHLQNTHLHTFKALMTADTTRLHFTPPIETLLGSMNFAEVASSYVRINIGNVAVMITIDGIRYGPISMLVQPDRVALEINGGAFQAFRCVYVHAFVEFANPDVLVLQNATGRQWDEAISGRGKYNIATRKADMQLFLNR